MKLTSNQTKNSQCKENINIYLNSHIHIFAKTLKKNTYYY